MGRAWKGEVAIDLPGAFPLVKRGLEFLGVFRNTAPFHRLQIDDPGELVGIDAVGVMDVTG